MFTPVAGRTVLVTGGTKGIGKGIARTFLQAGAHVAIAGRDQAAGDAAVADLGDGGAHVAFIQADVGVAADTERMVAETVAALRGPRRPVRQRRGLPGRPARGHDRAGHRLDLRDQRQGHDAGRQGRHRRPRAQRSRARDHHLVDHRPDHRLSRLVALRRHQGSTARLPAHGGDRARQARDHGQRGAAGEHRDRGARRARSRNTGSRWRRRFR